METIVIVVHMLAAIVIVGLVLLQQGKGADMGASFGSGASGTIFGSAGSGNVLTRATTWMAVVFFATSLFLAFIARQQSGGVESESSSLIQNRDQVESTLRTQPAVDEDLPQAPATGAQTQDLPQVPDAGAQDAAASEDLPQSPATGSEAEADAQAADDASQTQN